MQVCDWVSPLPPDKTDIANFTARVEEALAGTVRFNPIRDDRAHDLSAYTPGALPPFFNIGNDMRFHAGSLKAALSMGGIIVAHDHMVQHLLVRTLKSMPGDWAQRYRELMARAYGRPGFDAALELEAGRTDELEVMREFPALNIVATNAYFVISHNPLLAASISDSTGLYCFCLPLPITVPPHRSHESKTKDSFEILVFGFIGINRNVEILIDIVRQDESRNLSLTIAGAITSDDLQLAVDKAIANGTDIRFVGFADEEELDRLIHDADLVANVRSPSLGEVSGSQLRIFANCGLSVVADDQWYATLPDDAVFKVDAANLHRELPAIVDTLRRSPDKSNDMRSAGHRYVMEHHALPHYRSAFERMLEECDEAIQHGVNVRIASRCADLYNRVGAGPFVDIGRVFDQSRTLTGWTG